MIVREVLPDVTTLRILRAVGDTGSFRQAALTAGMSQQATSSRIKAAEALLGMTLVARTRRGSSLTGEGQLLVEWSVDFLEQADRLALSIRALRNDAALPFTVSASQTIAESFIPAWMAEFRRRSRAAQPFRLTSGNSAFVIDEVRSGRANVGLIETPEIPEDLLSATIQDDRLVVVVPVDHSWSRVSAVTAEELAATPLITREAGSGTRRTLELALAAAHPGLDLAEPIAVLSNTGAIRAAVLGGMGPAVLSAETVREDLERGMLGEVPIVGLDLSRPFTALWKPGISLPAAAQALFEVLRS